MDTVKFAGNPVKIVGKLPLAGEMAPEFTLVAQDLSDIKLEDFKGQRLILNIFPSMDTEVCAASVRHFNVEASQFPDTKILCVSMDLPFAATRFCTANGIENVTTGSGFRSDFGRKYGFEILEGPLRGLYARGLVVIDRDGRVLGTSICEEITNEPDYEFAKKLLS